MKNVFPGSLNSEKGFTLTELLVVIFVSSILLIGLFSLYSWHSKIYSYQQAVVGVTEQSRFIDEALQIYTAQATRVLASSTLEGVYYISTTTSVVLELPAIDQSGSALPGVFDKAALYLQGKNFFLKLSPDALSFRKARARLLSDSVGALTFSYSDPDFNLVQKVSIDAQLSKQSGDGTVVQNRLLGQANLRNHE